MVSPLRSKLQQVRRRVRYLLLLRGLARLLTILILGILAACCADAWWHLNAAEVRISLLTAITLVALVGSAVWLVRPWLTKIDDIDLSREMELARTGSLRSLASGVEFDSTSCRSDRGSPGLQHVVVEQQARRLAAEDLTGTVDTRSVQRAVVYALTACVLAGGALLVDHSRAAMALHRLALPWHAPAWPREHTLRLLGPDFQPLSPAELVTVAAGRTPTFYVEDIEGRLPDQVVLQLQQEDGELLERELVARDVEIDRKSQPVRLAAFSIPQHVDQGRFRAMGGDDERMPWHHMRTVLPPAIAHLDVRLRPPAYANRTLQVVSGPAEPLEALIGTTLELELTPSKSLRDALLQGDGQPARQLRERADAGVDSRYTIDWEIREPGRAAFWFELTDQSGLQNFPATRYEVIGVEDREPVVSIEHPPTHMTLTSIAVVPLRCVAEDDVGLTQVRLLYSDPPGSQGTQFYPLPAVDEGSLRADLETLLSMSDLDASPGAQFTFRVEASDACDLGPPHVGQSDRHTVLIVTAEEKLHELMNREVVIAESIERALAMQVDSARQTRQLWLQWQHTSRFRPEDQDLLSSVIHNSSRTEAELFDERRGAESRVAGILDELEWNRIDEPATRTRLHRVSTELQRLRSETIPVLQRSLATARKSSASVADDRTSDVADGLLTAESAQVDIRETLQTLLGMLRGWRERYDLVRSLAELSTEQEQLNLETAEFGQPLLEKDDLDEQDQADFARLADRQQHLSELFAELAATASQAVEQENSGRAADQESLLRLSEALRQSAAHNAMIRATELLRNHNIGEAMTTQVEVREFLQTLTDSLDQWNPADAETLLKQIERTEEEVETLRRRQSAAIETAAGMAAASPNERSSDELQRLRREQQQLAEETGESALRLSRQGMAEPAASSSRASEAMRDAAEALQDDISDAALDHQQRALDELQQTQQELARLRRNLELRFAVEQASELSATLDACRSRQLQHLEQTTQLIDAREQTGRLQRSQLSALNDLKRTQSELAADVAALTTDLADMQAFLIVLHSAVDAMHAAADRLTRDALTDAPRYQTAAFDQLTDVIDALTGVPMPAESADPTSPQDGASSAGRVDWTLLAQIRLLKRMQSQISGRIAELTRATTDGDSLTTEQQVELDNLTTLQGQAAAAAADLIPSAVGNSDPTPFDPSAVAP